ncbi:MAG: hypothetical protein AAGA34_05550 [Pseudomonadota bacterium]
MTEKLAKASWQKSLAGGFAFMTAPFAVHPYDKQRANEAVRVAKLAGVTQTQFLEEASDYLSTAMGWPTDVEEQLARVRKFISGKL